MNVGCNIDDWHEGEVTHPLDKCSFTNIDF